VNRFIWVARLTRSEDHLSRRASERANRQCSCGFGRTVPQFTFILLKRFVNSISAVSTGFLPVLPVFIGEGRKKRLFSWISSFEDAAASSARESKRFRKKVPDNWKNYNFCVILTAKSRYSLGGLWTTPLTRLKQFHAVPNGPRGNRTVLLSLCKT
jgi:hypothetical protein